MKRTLETWKWSLAAVTRAWVALVALAALSALWAYAAYQWLGLPESSLLLLLLALVWAVAQIFVAVSVLAGVAASAAETSQPGGAAPGRLVFMTFKGNLLSKTSAVVLVAALVVLALSQLFNWVNSHSIEVASFFTFHAQKPVSHVVIEKIFWVVESLVWIATVGLFLSFLINLLRSGLAKAWREAGRTFAECFWKGAFVTGVVAVPMFGGFSYLLATWHPNVTPGFLDYSQMILRMAGALISLGAGTLFWIFSLARLGLRPGPE